MFYRDIIDLINIQMSANENDIEVETELSRSVNIFANKTSIRQSEFYQASMQDINLIGMFEMRVSEYNGEKKLEYNNEPYYVVRTYNKDDEMIQLICSDKLIKISSSGK